MSVFTSWVFGELFDDSHQLFVIDIWRDISDAQPIGTNEHVEVLQHRSLVLLKLGSLLQISLGHSLEKKQDRVINIYKNNKLFFSLCHMFFLHYLGSLRSFSYEALSGEEEVSRIFWFFRFLLLLLLLSVFLRQGHVRVNLKNKKTKNCSPKIFRMF